MSFLFAHWIAISSTLGALGLGGGVAAWFLIPGAPEVMLPVLKWVWKSLVAHPLILVCIVLAVWLELTAADRNHWKSSAQRFHSDALNCQAGRKADRTAYQAAQNQAAAKNQADIQRTEQRQKEISDARVANLNDRLVLITNELRDHPSSKGSAGSTPLPETGPTPCRAFDPAWLCLSPADRLHAAQNEERQDQLIDWVIQQSQVDPNAEPGK